MDRSAERQADRGRLDFMGRVRCRWQSFVSLLAASLLMLLALQTGSVQAAEVSNPGDGEALITAAYAGLLGRTPDPAGLEFWLSELDRGVSASKVVELIGDADEQRRNVVRIAYEEILERDPDQAGLDYWSRGIIDRLTARDLHAQMFGSPEFFARSGGTTPDFVSALYRNILNREPETAGLDYWVALLGSGSTRVDIASAFLDSVEGILQPELSVVSASPRPGSTTGMVSVIDIELDRAVDASSSAVIVAVGGQRLRGSTSAVAGSNATLRFTSTSQVPVSSLGSLHAVVVTVFAYDGSTVERVDYGLTYRHNATALDPDDELLVAFYGHPRAPVLGVAGEGTPDEVLPRLQAQAAPYSASGQTIVPTWELIATLVTASPGPDDLYRSRETDASLRPYLENIRSVGGRMILDIQPGRASVVDEAMAHESLLIEPEVGLAVDPEWVVGPNETPKGRIGSIDASEINKVSAYLSELVLANNLPDKILIIHRFRPDMVTNPDLILSPPGVRLIFHADGEGGPSAKIGDYDTLMPPRFERGIKIFYDEDVNRMTPSQVLAWLDPTPTFVSYQ